MIEQRIAEAIGGDVNVAKVEKAVNNGILQEGYVVQSGEGPAPVFYVQDEWSGARKIDFVKRMYDSWKEQDNTEMEALLMTRIKEGFASADKFYESIIPAVISTEKNEGRLAEIVHDDISELGLSIVYRFKINTVEHVATVVLRHDHVDAFGFDFDMEKLRAAAKRRIEDELLIQRASDVFAKVGIKIDDEDDIEFYVATVNDLAFGAAVIASEKNLRKMHEAAGSEQIIVIPSSVDEVMFLPLDDDIDPALVSAMVREVNVEGPVSPENVLDDVAYIHTLNGDWRRV